MSGDSWSLEKDASVRGNRDLISLVIILAAVTVVFHLWMAARGMSIARDQHLGGAVEYARGRIDLLRPMLLGFNANGAPTPLEFPIWQAITAALMTIIVYPFGPTVNLPFFGPVKLVIAQFDIALLYVLGITSVGVYGIMLAGWASNSKYSLMGGLRASAQMISYELSLGLSLVGVVLMSETLDLYSVVEQQSRFFGLHWNIIYQPLGFIIYLISAIAETYRVPFDLPEAETELVAGFHTEYSALKFALFFMAEYVNMFTVSVLATTLFLGGWNGPGVATFPVLGVFYFLGKIIFFLFLYIWLRGTLPRFRFDQLMNFGWTFLLPAAILNIVLTATVAYFFY